MSPGRAGTLLGTLCATAEREPERPALVQADGAISYGDLVERIAGAKGALQDAGVRPGDRVLLCASNSAAVPIIYFAIHAAQAIAVLTAPDTPAAALAAIADRAQPRVTLLDRNDVTLEFPTLSAVELATHRATPEFDYPNLNAPADLLFTSGTTGRKKGVLLSHANTVAAARNISDFLGVRSSDVQAVPLPLSHSFGLGCVRSMAWAGHALLIERGLVNPAGMLKRMSRFGATGLAVVPSGLDVIRRMTGDALGGLRDTLRFIEIGSAPIAPDLREWLIDLLPSTRLCHHYGMTEASRSAFTEYHADAGRTGTIGRASPNVTITILDEAGQPLPVGEAGEIAISGDVVMSEYWLDPELSAARLGPHGLASGDLGRLDDAGYVYLLGRRDDVINVGGRKVVPDEVEELLRTHPAISDAVCVAMPDPVLGHCVEAHIVRDGAVDAAVLLEWLRPQLEDYKLPRAFIDIDVVPKTTSGKIQRQLVGKTR